MKCLNMMDYILNGITFYEVVDEVGLYKCCHANNELKGLKRMKYSAINHFWISDAAQIVKFKNIVYSIVMGHVSIDLWKASHNTLKCIQKISIGSCCFSFENNIGRLVAYVSNYEQFQYPTFEKHPYLIWSWLYNWNKTNLFQKSIRQLKSDTSLKQQN